MKTRRNLVLRLLVLSALSALSTVSPVRANTIWFVKQGATSTPLTGLSWASAFATLDEAIAAASPTLDSQGQSDQVWCAMGQYFPAAIASPPNGFVITKPLELYGGFIGTESSVQGRLGSFARTVLDGNVPTVGNVAHVVDIQRPAALALMSVVIDGFKITGGSGLIGGVPTNGAGISSIATDLDLANCFVRSNLPGTSYQQMDGGGLYFTGGATTFNTLRVKNCEFSDNSALEGGAICAENNVRGEVVNTQILLNYGLAGGGGVSLKGMALGSAYRFDFTNCVFRDNVTSNGLGSGLSVGSYLPSGPKGNARLVNCTVAGNTSHAIHINQSSLAEIHNSIVWSNGSNQILDLATPPTIITYSDIQGGWAYIGSHHIINSDPLFVNLGGGDLSLNLGSDCFDRADYGQLPLDTLDLDGDGDTVEIIPWDISWSTRCKDLPWVIDQGAGTFTFLDMGAYEYH